jgi:heparan-alpha-glucosaminide N-acetyltransferase
LIYYLIFSSFLCFFYSGFTTSIILTFLGLQMGKILVAFPSPMARLSRWLCWSIGLALLTVVLVLVGVPINKNLWSASFICATASLAFAVLSLLYIVIDVRHWWPHGQPFNYPGMNAILLYVGHSMTGRMFPWRFYMSRDTHAGPLTVTLTGVTLWFVISVQCARNGFFLTV